MGALVGKLAEIMPDAAGEPEEEIYLWPDCAQAWDVFWQLKGQWHSGGMGGRTGLSLACVRAHLDELGVDPGPERRELWQLLLDAQDAALATWAQLREREAS